MILLVYIIVNVLIFWTDGRCPHRETDLLLWSEPKTWPQNTKPALGESVEISKPILMDESPPDLYNITVTARGRLVFDPRVPLHVRVANIFVYGGLFIGSEDCLHDNDLKITLTGTRETHGIEEEPKAILVPSGGTLEIHGKRKLSWTKLDGTMVPLRDTGDIIFQHQTYDRANPSIPADAWVDRSFVSGIAAYTIRFSPSNKPVIKTFNVYNLISEGNMLAQQIQQVGVGEVLMLANQLSIRLKADRTQQYEAFDALENLVYGRVTGSSKLRTVAMDNTYALVYHKGREIQFVEVTNPVGTDAMAHLTIGDRVFVAEVKGSVGPNNQFDNFKILTINGFNPLVNVIDDRTSWKPGDKVVFASTDYDWEQAEERIVEECLDCSNTQFRINKPLNYVHWGEFMFGAVDMRAEVGLLTRNVVIEGEMESDCPKFNGNCKIAEVRGLDTFGGHIKILEGYAAVHMEGAELRNMGQQTDNGRYPVHFHMCMDGTAEPYVRKCSIHNSFARCITIHASHNIKVIDNFCYNHMGHGYFLEDGAELNNTLDGNLAMTTRKATGELEPVDKNQPTSFWITNPNNRFKNNVAAGGEGNGVWLIYPDEPLGDSKPLNTMLKYEARSTRILEFNNIVGHSNSWAGVQLGSRVSPSRTVLAQATWQPRVDPKDRSSKPMKVKIEKITAYKNRRNNVWIEGGMIEVSKISSSDSLNGIAVTNDGLVDEFAGSLSDSVIVGDSINVGVASTIAGRSVPMDIRPEEPHSGLTLWKGPTKHSNLWFGGSFHNDNYDSAAVAMKRFSPYFLSAQTSLTNMLFAFDDTIGGDSRAISGLEGFDRGWKSRDGAFIAGFTLNTNETEFPKPAYIVRPDQLSAAAKDCKVRDNWRLAVCSTKYGNLKTLSSKPATFVRHDLPAAQLLFSMAGQTGPQVVLDGSRIYTVHFENKIPGKLVFTGEGMEKGDELIIGVCLPRDASFKLKSRTPKITKTFVKVNSLDELQRRTNDDGKKYYHDTRTGMLYYKFIDTRVKSPDEMHPCVKGVCPDFVVDRIKGNKADADCRQRLYGSDLKLPLPEPKTFKTTIPRNADPMPPTGWGAGSTRPFSNRNSVDGGYGGWSEWTPCSKTCGDGLKFRTRTCNNPLPANGGKPCVGDSVEQAACNGGSCSKNGQIRIDGVFTGWTLWGNCQYHGNGDCQGTQKRIRLCSNPRPQFGGVACTGATDEMQPCNNC